MEKGETGQKRDDWQGSTLVRKPASHLFEAISFCGTLGSALICSRFPPPSRCLSCVLQLELAPSCRINETGRHIVFEDRAKRMCHSGLVERSGTVIYALVGNFLHTDSTHQGDFGEHCKKALRLLERMTLSEQNYIDTAVIGFDFYLVSRPVM